MLLESSLVVEYFSTKFVSMVTVFSPQCPIMNFIFAKRLQEVSVKCLFWFCLILAHLVVHKIS